MLRNLSMFAAVIFVSLFAANKLTTSDAAAKIYGDWTGESICVDKQKFPACKHEKGIYHFPKSKKDASKIHLVADKIVNGETIVGTLKMLPDKTIVKVKKKD